MDMLDINVVLNEKNETNAYLALHDMVDDWLEDNPTCGEAQLGDFIKEIIELYESFLEQYPCGLCTLNDFKKEVAGK